jgi:hypothetical protein
VGLRGPRTAGLTFLLTLALLLVAGGAVAGAAKRSVRVAPDYFGVNYPLMMFDSGDVRARQLDAIAEAGIESVRVAISWRDLEPGPPVGGVHAYDVSRSDFQVAALARHGLRMMPAFLLAPAWATPDEALLCRFAGVPTSAVGRIGDYAAAAKALARRYGPGGTFWRENPVLPRRPIQIWQIWNEPNLTSYWCPRPDPAAYAELFAQAAKAIKEAQPQARVITAGLALHNHLGRPADVESFLAGALAARPDLWALADGAGVHMYPGGAVEAQLASFAEWRARLSLSGAPRTEPMYATEVGWGLAGPFGLTETERAERYRFVTTHLPRSNCNVAMMNAQAWTTSHESPVWDFAAGIVDPVTARLFPSAIEFRDAAATMRGEGPREAPFGLVDNCSAMPKLDRDGDGRADHRDYWPLDARRWRGPRCWYRAELRGTGVPKNCRPRQAA